MATCVVSGTIKDPSETAVSGAVIKASVIAPTFSSTTLIVPYEVSTTSAADGTWSLTLVRSLQYTVAIEYPPNSTQTKVRYTYAITVPDSASSGFSTLATEV